MATDVQPTDPGPPPFPMGKVVMLCWVQFGETFSVGQLVPYAALLVKRDLGREKDDNDATVGVLSSVLIAAYIFGQFLSGFPWGGLADRIGRRPVLLLGLAGGTLANLAFGFAKALPLAVCVRFACGLCNGNMGVVKSYLAELLPPEQQSRAFALITLCWSVGLFVGPLVGGLLTFDPWSRDPSWMDGTVFSDFPYLLPNIVSAAVCLSGLFVTYFRLPETPKFLDRKARGVLAGGSLSPLSLIKIPAELRANGAYKKVLVLYALIGGTGQVVQQSHALFTQIGDDSRDGYGWDEEELGYVNAAGGLGMVPMTLLLFPYLERKIGAIATWRIAFVPCAVLPLIVPMNDLLPKGGGTPALVANMAWFFLFMFFYCASFCCAVCAINNSVPHRLRGTANGCANSILCLFRSTLPLGLVAGYGWVLDEEHQSGFARYFPLSNRYVFAMVIAVLVFVMLLLVASLPESLNRPRPDSVRPEPDQENEPLVPTTGSGKAADITA
eukprot:TRINITY_DN14791_c0_g1_i1.p1 TRINITY_DN14791_c0_g1~~TRINITY_DN14791_c0_g1_i1.p1  ORF type:complete len:513 (+),score=111.08 TRINITY_DN14791_c0_g1_i1:48-1541(+)